MACQASVSDGLIDGNADDQKPGPAADEFARVMTYIQLCAAASPKPQHP
jgi:hypothetical protein